jgi:heterodisulfide reductase subunit B
MSEIERKHTNARMSKIFGCAQLMTVAYGGTAKEAGLDGHLIQPTKLQQLAAKK